MGVAAYNRGSVAIRRTLGDEGCHIKQFVADLNELPKYPDAGTPPGDLVITFSRGVWWVNVASNPDGYGYWYRSIREAVRRWRVYVIGPDYAGRFIGVPDLLQMAGGE